MTKNKQLILSLKNDHKNAEYMLYLLGLTKDKIHTKYKNKNENKIEMDKYAYDIKIIHKNIVIIHDFINKTLKELHRIQSC